MNREQQMDVVEFSTSFQLRDSIEGHSFLITGATGLIGSMCIYCLLSVSKTIRIIAPVRDMDKAQKMFKEQGAAIELVECDLLSFDYESLGPVDYIIHCAAPTASKYFIEHPIETFDTIVKVTEKLLLYAKKYMNKGFVYLSSLEVYGTITDDSVFVREDVQGYIDPLNIRSSYPMAKRAAEHLCHLYAVQYGLPIKIARLTQTTGSGISKDDNRVIAQFAKLASQGQDIVLHTTGESARPYCYTTDAVSAILYILLNGCAGAAYNVANEATYISARGMAEYLHDNFNPSINVRVELNENMGYAPPTKLRLSTEKLQKLGWSPRKGLKEIFNSLIEYLNSLN